MFTISREGVQDANRDGLLGANRSNSLAIARICNNADRPIPRLHTRVEIVNTLLGQRAEDFLHHGAGTAQGVLANFLFFLANHQVQAVQRFAGDVGA